jgi:hypothetical protein
MLSRRRFAAALAALPFARPTAAATIPDIHQLQPFAIETAEWLGSLKRAIVTFGDPDHADLRGKTYGFYGTPLVATRQGADGSGTTVWFEEINL